jgi:hypothetical protein
MGPRECPHIKRPFPSTPGAHDPRPPGGGNTPPDARAARARFPRDRGHGGTHAQPQRDHQRKHQGLRQLSIGGGYRGMSGLAVLVSPGGGVRLHKAHTLASCLLASPRHPYPYSPDPALIALIPSPPATRARLHALPDDKNPALMPPSPLPPSHSSASWRSDGVVGSKRSSTASGDRFPCWSTSPDRCPTTRRCAPARGLSARRSGPIRSCRPLCVTSDHASPRPSTSSSRVSHDRTTPSTAMVSRSHRGRGGHRGLCPGA